MAGTKISNLTAGTPETTGVFPYSNSVPATYKTTFPNAKNAILNPGTVTGQKLAVTAANTAGFIDDDFEMNYIIGNAGTSAISATGLYPSFRTHRAGVIEAIEIMAGTIVGNATVKVFKGNYGTPPIGTAQTILGAVGTEVITFTGGTKAVGTPTTTAFSAGDYFAPYLVGAGTIPYLTIAIHCRSTAVS